MLAHGYHVIDPDLVLPRVRATIERECDLIAQGRAKLDDVVPHALQMFRNKYRYFVAKIQAVRADVPRVKRPRPSAVGHHHHHPPPVVAADGLLV